MTLVKEEGRQCVQKNYLEFLLVGLRVKWEFHLFFVQSSPLTSETFYHQHHQSHNPNHGLRPLADTITP